MENLLIRGLTEEEQQMLKELQIKDAREEGREEGERTARFEDIEKLAADDTISAEKACEVLGVSMEDYLKWKESREE